MRKRHNGLWWALGLGLAFLLAFGLEQVLIAPLQTGEVYPPYSTLRSDPMGAKALYESLGEMPGLDVERWYKSRSSLDAGTAMFVLGVDPVGWSEIEQKTLTEYEDLLSKGGRLVIGFIPVARPSKAIPARVVKDRWDLSLAYRESDDDAGQNGAAPRRDAIPRQTSLYFEPGPEWRTLLDRDGKAVAVERDLAGGTVALLADSYPLSNEGLRDARDAQLVAKLAGPSRRILFDENHFGVTETGSVAQLMERYHLVGAAAVLAFAALLFLWRSASSFLPPRESITAQAVAGRDSLAGLTALLRRSVPESELTATCYAECLRSAKSSGNRATAAVQELEAEIAKTGKGNPVESYRAACAILKPARTKSGFNFVSSGTNDQTGAHIDRTA